MDLVIMHIEYANIVLIDQIAVDEYRTLHHTSLLFLSHVSIRGREYSGMLFVLKATQMLKKCNVIIVLRTVPAPPAISFIRQISAHP